MTMEGLARVRTILIALAVIAYSASARAQSLPGGFVYLRDIDPTIIQDIRYAGSNHFVGRRLAGYEAGEFLGKRGWGLALEHVPQAPPPPKMFINMPACYHPA